MLCIHEGPRKGKTIMMFLLCSEIPSHIKATGSGAAASSLPLMLGDDHIGIQKEEIDRGFDYQGRFTGQKP